jgi:NTE family protein
MLLLSSIALPQSDVQNFDDLPVPFRCVATDLASGTPVVLGSGSLAVALRATMAIPGVFDPVSVDGRLLADGGLVDNVPVDVVRGLGADIVVAVDVHAVSRDSVPETLLGVLQSALEIPVQANAQSQLAHADIVVRVDPRNFRTTDYASSIAVIEEGYRAAARQAAKLLPLALEPAAWEAHLAARRPPPSGQPDVPAFVVVEGVPRPEAEWIARGLEQHAGRPFDRSLLERDLDRLVGTGRYASAGYEWAASDSGRGLRVRVREKPYGPPTVRFGIEADNERDDVTLTVGARIMLIDVTSRGSEARLDVALGTEPRIAAELLQPLGRDGLATRSRFFVAPRGFVRREQQDFYAGEERIAATRRTRAGAGADAGWIGGTRFQVRAGYEIGAVDEDVETGSLPEPEAEGREQVAGLRLEYDGQDAATIPRRGAFADAEARWYLETPGAADDCGRGAAAIGMAVPWRDYDRTLVVLEGEASFGGGDPPLGLQPTLGGLLRLGAFQADELRGRHTAHLRLAHLVSIARLGGLSGDRLYAAASAEFGSAFDEFDRARGLVSASLGFVADTAIGPCALGASLGSEGRWRIHFTAGKSLR